MPPGERRCCLCGATRTVEVGHVDGDERNTARHNLVWTCRSCNVLSANTLRRAGLGRKTRQYNPGSARNPEGAKTLAQWLTAVQSMKGASSEMPVEAAVAMIHATPAERRSRFAKEIWRKRRAHGTDRRGESVPF